MIAPIAQDLARINHILPSVVIAQTCVETGFGKTDLARLFNIIGMKADLINSTWQQWSVWDGETYGKDSPEGNNGEMKYSLFRVYKTFRQCLDDYEAFLLHVQNNKGLKYARIKDWTDPAKVINAIRIGTGTNRHPEGYATDADYETKVMNLINSYDLTRFDVVMVDDDADPQQEPVPAPVQTDTKYRVQIGAYEVLRYADAAEARVMERTGLGCFRENEADGYIHIYCGSFSEKANAKKRKKLLQDADIDCDIKEVR